jgi:uncharacterized UBP type Zn finger protein
VKNKWSEEDRRAFGDGVRLRAQRINGKRWYDADHNDNLDLCRSCGGLGCGACQSTGYAGGREP